MPQRLGVISVLGAIPFRLALAYALGFMGPMLFMWFFAPALQEYLTRRGVDVGDAWTFEWWLGIIPHPVPFTARAALGLALMVVPPVAFLLLWFLAHQRADKWSSSTGTRSRSR